MPDDPPSLDFAARIAQHRAMAQAYRARAQVTADELLRKVFSGLATTYENMARAIEQTATRVENIELTAERARLKIRKSEPGDAGGRTGSSA